MEPPGPPGPPGNRSHLAEETVAYVRTWGHGLPLGERSEVIRYGWQQLSTLLQVGNAEMILSAKGF